MRLTLRWITIWRYHVETDRYEVDATIRLPIPWVKRWP